MMLGAFVCYNGLLGRMRVFPLLRLCRWISEEPSTREITAQRGEADPQHLSCFRIRTCA